MTNHRVTVATTLPLDVADMLDSLPGHNTADRIRQCIVLGAQVKQYHEMMKDPSQADEFRRKMSEMMDNASMDEWVQTLTGEQINGFLMFLQTEKESRVKQGRLK